VARRQGDIQLLGITGGNMGMCDLEGLWVDVCWPVGLHLLAVSSSGYKDCVPDYFCLEASNSGRTL
jgi:hypothetical protein